MFGEWNKTMIIESRQIEKQNIALIDILKGICIIFVIITHLHWEGNERLKYLFPFWIEMAVPVFMFISGYVYAFSYKKRGIEKVEDAYLLKNIICNITRYTIPYTMFFIVEEILYIVLKEHTVSPGEILNMAIVFASGGNGPGSYYFPIMIQFIFVYPIIYFIIKKYNFRGVYICFFINAIYEFLQKAYEMNGEFYRMILLRYVLVIAVGCFMAGNRCLVNKMFMLISFVVGISFIICHCYLGYEPKVITYWTGTSYVASLYIIPITILIISKFTRIKFKPLEIVGKASYNIFLVQMVWFTFGYEKMLQSVLNRKVQFLVTLFICISVGIIFYCIESPIRKRINQGIIFRTSEG